MDNKIQDIFKKMCKLGEELEILDLDTLQVEYVKYQTGLLIQKLEKNHDLNEIFFHGEEEMNDSDYYEVTDKINHVAHELIKLYFPQEVCSGDFCYGHELTKSKLGSFFNTPFNLNRAVEGIVVDLIVDQLL